MKYRNNTVFSFIFFSIILLYVNEGVSAENIILLASYESNKNKCSITFWLSDVERKRLMYKSKGEKWDGFGVYCKVTIPTKEFEKYFDYCSLSGIRNTGSDKFSIDFSGKDKLIEEKIRDHYWFTWYDASHVSATYQCIQKAEHRKRGQSPF